jgi:hypothetical protein
MAVSWRRLELSHILLYAGFTVAAANSFRFAIFHILMSVTISSSYITDTVKTTLKKFRPALSALSLASIILLFTLSAKGSSFRQGELKSDYLPGKAVDFMLEQNLKAPLFNPYEWGGYLIYRLHPNHRVFIDSRTLDYSAHMDYMSIRMGKKDIGFRKYDINTVLFYPLTPYSYKIPGLIFSLLKDPEWQLVYIDEKSVIFVRDDAKAGMPVLSKKILWDSLIKTAEFWLEKPPAPIERVNPNFMLGQIYKAMGNEEKAAEYYKKARQL